MLRNTLPSLCNYYWHVLEQGTYSKLQQCSYLLANKRLVLLVSSHRQVLKVSFLLYQRWIPRLTNFKGLVKLEFKTYTRSRAILAGLMLHRCQCDGSAQMSNERQFLEIFAMTRYDCSCSFSLPTSSPSKMWTLFVCVCSCKYGVVRTGVSF